MLIFTFIIALSSIASFWNVYETHRLVDLQTAPQVYFDVDFNSSPIKTYKDRTLFLNHTEIKDEDSLFVFEVSNMGYKPIKIHRILANGSCMDTALLKRYTARYVLLYRTSLTLKSGDYKTDTLKDLDFFVVDPPILPCEINFILEFEGSTAEDRVVLE